MIVPAELQHRRQWVLWELEQNGRDKPTKVLYIAQSDRKHAKSNTPDTWRSYAVARKFARQNGYQGVGFVVTKADPYTVLDLDGCINANDELDPVAAEIIEAADSYTELSPSGSGVHIWIEGVKSVRRCQNNEMPWGGKLEVYDDLRYMTVTGEHLEGTPTQIQPAAAFLKEIEARYLGDGGEPGRTLLTAAGQVSAASTGNRHDANKAVIVSMRLAGARTAQIKAVVKNLCANYNPPLDKQRIEGELRMVDESENWNLAHEAQVLQATERERARRQAHRLVDAEEAQLVLPEPPRLTLRQELAEPEDPEPYAIEQLALEDGNVLIPALRKAGKTVLLFNLAKSLVDGDNFLGRFEARALEGRVVVLSYEMLRKASLRWMEKIGVRNQDAVTFWHLRSWSLPFWLPEVMEFAAAQLAAWECEVLLIDSAGAASSGLVRNFNDRAQVTAFTLAIDQLKRRAGVRECYMLIHMGWAAQGAEDDQAHTLGSEAWEAWPDMIWPYELDKDKRTRMLRVLGRGDDEPPTPFALTFDPNTKLLTAGVEREEHRGTALARAAMEALQRCGDGATTTDLKADMKGVAQDDRQPAVVAAEDRGWLERRSGPRGARLCFMTKAGRQAVSVVVTRGRGESK